MPRDSFVLVAGKVQSFWQNLNSRAFATKHNEIQRELHLKNKQNKNRNKNKNIESKMNHERQCLCWVVLPN